MAQEQRKWELENRKVGTEIQPDQAFEIITSPAFRALFPPPTE